MRNTILLAVIIFIFSSCKKDDNNGSGNNNSSNNNNDNNNCGIPPYRIGSIVEYKRSDGKIEKKVFDIDTIIGSKKYFRIKNSTPYYEYMSFENNGDVFVSYLRGLNDLNEVNIIFCRISAAVGTKWNYDFTSYTNSNVKHRYSFELISRNETFTFNSKNYINGIKTKLIIETFENGGLREKYEYDYTYFCGLGFATQIIKQNQFSLTAELSNYLY